MKTISQLQSEVSEWSLKNFGPRPSYIPFLGMIEELGEIAHAQLKLMQEIRGSKDEHRENLKDSIGDLVIYSLDFCSKEGLNLRDLLDSENFFITMYFETPEIHISNMSADLANINLHCYTTGLNNLILDLNRLAACYEWNLHEIVETTWLQVSKRDWTKFKLNGIDK